MSTHRYIITLFLIFLCSPASGDPPLTEVLIPTYKYQGAPPIKLDVSSTSPHAAGRVINAYNKIVENLYPTPITFRKTPSSFIALDRELYKRGVMRDKTDSYCQWLREHQSVIQDLITLSETSELLPSQGNFIYNYAKGDPRIQLRPALGFANNILSHDAIRLWVRGDRKESVERAVAILQLSELLIQYTNSDPILIANAISLQSTALENFEWMTNTYDCTPEDKLLVNKALNSINSDLFDNTTAAYAIHTLSMINWVDAQFQTPETTLDFWKLHQQLNVFISRAYASQNLPSDARTELFSPLDTPEQLFQRAASRDSEFAPKLKQLTDSYNSVSKTAREVCGDLMSKRTDHDNISLLMKQTNAIDNLIPDLLQIRSLDRLISKVETSEKLFVQLVEETQSTSP